MHLAGLDGCGIMGIIIPVHGSKDWSTLSAFQKVKLINSCRTIGKAFLDLQGDEYVLDARDFYVRVYGDPEFHAFRCKKCGRITTSNVRGLCSLVKCGGALEEVSPDKIIEGNHYANLYQSTQMKPLQIKEHTAQLAKNHQTLYQQAFVDHKINALSCSTTFEMGVDVGTLETVYMRNVPPSRQTMSSGLDAQAEHLIPPHLS